MTASRRLDAAAIGLLVAFLAFLLYFLAPIAWLVINSTKTNDELFSTFAFRPGTIAALGQNVRDVLTTSDGVYLEWIRNTALYSGTAALCAVVVCTMAGYVFAKHPSRSRNILFWIVLGTIMVPNTALAVPTFQLVSRLQLINTPWAVILPSIISPFGVYLMRVYTAQAVPDALLDAARVDGAGELRILWSIVGRLVSPAAVTVFLLVFVATWNNYLLPLLVLSDPHLYPLTVGLANWYADSTHPGTGGGVLYPLVITGAMLAALPLLVAFLVLQRYWRGGLTVGAVQ